MGGKQEEKERSATEVDIGDVVSSLSQVIAGQAVQIATLQALNKKLMGKLGKDEKERVRDG